jgi:DNA-binding NarL/FixJ family response regulator
MPEPIRVLIVDDFRVIAEALAAVLGRESDLEMVGVAFTVAEAIRVAARERPDVVVLDYHLPDGTGAEAATAIRQELPRVAVVMLTSESDEAARHAVREAGACGFVTKSQAVAELSAAVRRAAAGEALLPPPVEARLIRGGDPRVRRWR